MGDASRWRAGRVRARCSPSSCPAYPPSDTSAPASTHRRSKEMATPPQSSARIARDPEPACARVLVVEDDLDIRETVAELLLEEGYEVQTAVSGRDALEYLAEAPALPDVVLLDLMMPI